MRKKLFQVWLVLASIAFCLLISRANVVSLAISILIGTVIGLLLVKFHPNYCFWQKPIEAAIDIIIDIFVIWNSSSIFFDTWSPSSKMRSILGDFSSNDKLLLRIISLMLAAFTIPFIHTIISNIVRWIIKAFKSIRWKEIWSVKPIRLKSFLKSTGICVSNIILAALCGLAVLVAVYKLPLENIIVNVEKSASIMDEEGTYPSIFSWCTSQLDNFTDAIMLAEAADTTDESALNKALMAYRGGTDKGDVREALVEHFIDGKEYTKTSSYARYWHGYHLFIKPLLELMDYGAIRILNGIFQLVVFLTICWLMKRKNLTHFVIPYSLFYLILMPIALACSLQFSSCYYVISIGMILLLLLSEEKLAAYVWIVFLNIGILTAFFDFLTYPIATFGVPAALLLALTAKDEAEMKLRRMLETGVAWCVGYGGMWISKWILTAIFTDFNIFGNAFTAFSGRISLTSPDGKTKYSIFSCIIENYQTLFCTPVTILIVFTTIVLAFSVIKKRDDSVIKIMVPYTVLALAPIVWFCFATNHSMIHSWFTNKCCVVSVVAILFGLMECFVSLRNKSLDEIKEIKT